MAECDYSGKIGTFMRIDHLQVTNHSRIGDLDLDVRGHAVIIGANDVGKSSLLRLLQLLLGSSTGQLFQQLSLADLRDQAVALMVEVRFIDFTDQERRLFPQEISIDQTTKAESLRVRLEVAADPDDSEAVAIRRWSPEAGHDRAPIREQLAAFGWRYLPATRGASAASLDGPNSALQTLLRTIDLGTEKAKLAGLLDGFNIELSTSDRIKRLRKGVAQHLSKAMPRAIAQDDLAVRTATDPEQDVLGDVTMFFERDGDHVPLGEQSDGLRQLMSMTLFDLAEGAANVVAIDEPELHLHPSSQRTVAQLFHGASNQKFLATHSPFIVQRFEPRQIIAVKPDGTSHQLPAAELSRIEKLRANWWSPRLLEALTARYAVIVEGTSDRVMVERVAELMDVHLDQLGAIVFDIGGAENFPHVYRLLGKTGFNVPILGLVDEAQKMSWHGQIGGKPATVFGTVLWASNPDLEGEYCNALTGPGAARVLVAAGFCKEATITSTCSVSDLDDVASADLAEYCRKDKVGAAVAIASQLDATTAARITGVYGLLDRLRTMASA